MVSIDSRFRGNDIKEQYRYSYKYNIRGGKMIERDAKKEYLEKIKIETLKKALIEQCEDNAKLNLEICNDFKYVDGEQE